MMHSSSFNILSSSSASTISHRLSYNRLSSSLFSSRDLLPKLSSSSNKRTFSNRFLINKTLLNHSTKSLLFGEYQFRKMSQQVDLNNDELKRYGRQLILNEIGKEGQLKLKSSSVLIVGCGGLGCPSSMYLAAAGVGRIGLLDHDQVEMSNLHRQTLHTEAGIGTHKADSIKANLSKLNSNVQFDTIKEKLTNKNCVDIIKNYDIVIDASDNAPTRYIVNDACVVTGKTLVSGSALKFDGQLTVYNYQNETACYRCLYPNAPPAGTVTNCSDGGVLGVVPGIIGSMQALETIKILAGLKPSYAGKMLLFDGLDGTFRTIKIRNKNEDCQVCSKNASIKPVEFDYEKFCGTPSCDTAGQLKILHDLERVDSDEYKQVLQTKQPHILIDVRPANDFNIVNLENAENIPLKDLRTKEGLEKVFQLIEKEKKANNFKSDQIFDVYCLCRRGNASQHGVRFLKDNISELNNLRIRDIKGGITKYLNVDY